MTNNVIRDNRINTFIFITTDNSLDFARVFFEGVNFIKFCDYLYTVMICYKIIRYCACRSPNPLLKLSKIILLLCLGPRAF